MVKVWDIENLTEPIVEYKTNSEINDIKFNTANQWIAVATNDGVAIWDLQSENDDPLQKLTHETTKKIKKGKSGTMKEKCTSLCWDNEGHRLFAGFSDGAIRVWDIFEDQ